MRENFLGIPMPVCDERVVREHYRMLTQTLIDKNYTISTMESATGGQLASLITDTEGASTIYKGSFVTYSNDAKTMNGVPSDIIEKYSVYSVETAEAMAKSCREAFDVCIGIGITGTFGNVDLANKDNSFPGEVYFAISIGDEVMSFARKIPQQPTRLLYKLYMADMIYVELDKIIKNKI